MSTRPLPLAAALAVILWTCGGALAQTESKSPSGWLGVLLEDVRPPSDESATDRPRGVRLTGIVEDGPAARAGLRARDLIVAVEGRPVEGARDLISRLSRMEPDRWVSVSVERDGREREIRMRLGERPADTSGLRIRAGWVGLKAIDLPPALREHFGASEDAGVMVSWVEPGSPAEAAGFELGDVVYEAGGKPVGAARQLDRVVRSAGIENVLEFTLMRDGVKIVLEATVDVEPEDTASDDGDKRRRPRRRSP